MATRGPCLPGNLLAIAGSITSLLTVLIGFIYIYNKPPSFQFSWSDCTWSFPDKYSTDCNQLWQNNWGMTALPNYTPLLIGIFGAMMFQPGVMQVCGFPRNFLQYGLFLIVQGFVGDMGFCGKLGVAVGVLSTILGVICLGAAGMSVKSSRMLLLEEEYKVAECDVKSEMYDSEGEAMGRPGASPMRAGASPGARAGASSAKDLFAQLDTDGDGILSREELAAGITSGTFPR
ncbi:unnamed protein product [Effrenium voratum]|nr:unnamed protein product [Effrenium voratum]